jgi:hypothetical protein
MMQFNRDTLTRRWGLRRRQSLDRSQQKAGTPACPPRTKHFREFAFFLLPGTPAPRSLPHFSRKHRIPAQDIFACRKAQGQTQLEDHRPDGQSDPFPIPLLRFLLDCAMSQSEWITNESRHLGTNVWQKSNSVRMADNPFRINPDE